MAKVLHQNQDVLVNQCLNISNYMYYGQYTTYNSTPLQSALNLRPLTVNGQIVKVTNASQGLFEEAFVTPGSGPNREIVIGYEGTNLYNESNPNYYQFTGGQVVDDACIGAGQVAPSFQPAANFANKVLQIANKIGVAKSNVFVTGHSLGAAEAEYAAARTGLSGYTFGTPGIVAPTNAKASSLTNYVDYGDPVGNYASDGQDAYGPQTYPGIFKNYSYPRIIISNSIKHYQGLNLVGSSSNYTDLYDAIEDYNEGDDFGLVDFDDALPYHYLTNYAKDLQAKFSGVNLIPIGSTGDGSIGSDAGIFGLAAAAAPNSTVCFAGGTLIKTVDGDTSVEALAIGDLVLTVSGEARPIRWIGHRALDCRHHPRPHESHPVCIAAHAFGEGRPSRDLFVSPGHAICVDVVGEVLIPAGALVNGATVQQVDVDEITYWHVELESHDVILAENLPAESYLDMGNRGFFREANIVDLAAGPDANPAQRTHANFCRPFVDGGPVLDAVKAQLRRRAESLGWAQSDALEMHLVVDGRRLDPVVRGLTARFEVPAEAKDVWLEAPTSRPCDVTGSGDGRDLGLFIKALRIDDGFEVRDIAIDDPLLCIGFHPVEEGSMRWTTGRARLPAALWKGFEHDSFLRVELAAAPVPRWVAPMVKADRPLLAIVA